MFVLQVSCLSVTSSCCPETPCSKDWRGALRRGYGPYRSYSPTGHPWHWTSSHSAWGWIRHIGPPAWNWFGIYFSHMTTSQNISFPSWDPNCRKSFKAIRYCRSMRLPSFLILQLGMNMTVPWVVWIVLKVTVFILQYSVFCVLVSSPVLKLTEIGWLNEGLLVC